MWSVAPLARVFFLLSLFEKKTWKVPSKIYGMIFQMFLLRSISNDIFREKSVCLPVCLSVYVSICPSVPSCKKVTETENIVNKVVRYTLRVSKIYSNSCCGVGWSQAELCIHNLKTTLQSFITTPELIPSSCGH